MNQLYYYSYTFGPVATLATMAIVFTGFYFLKLKLFKSINSTLKKILTDSTVVIEKATTYRDRTQYTTDTYSKRTIHYTNGLSENLDVRERFTSVLFKDRWKFIVKNNGHETLQVKIKFGYHDKFGRIGEGYFDNVVSIEQLRPKEEKPIFFTVKDTKNKLFLEELTESPIRDLSKRQTFVINQELPKVWLVNRLPSWPISFLMMCAFFPSINFIGAWAFAGIALCGAITYGSALKRSPITVVTVATCLFSFYFEQYLVSILGSIGIGINYLKVLSPLDFFRPDPVVK